MINGSSIRRGDIYFATLDDYSGCVQNGDRPVLVIQNNMANMHAPTVIVAPISTVIRNLHLPTHVVIAQRGTMRCDSMVKVENLLTLSKDRLIRYMGSLNDWEMERIDLALLDSLALRPSRRC